MDPEPDNFAALLKARLAKRGRGAQTAFAAEMTARGVKTSRQVVNRWCGGSVRPESWKWSVLLSVLRVPAADRKRWEAALTARPDEAESRDLAKTA